MNRSKSRFHLAAICALTLGLGWHPVLTEGSLIVNFSNGDSLEGDSAGDTSDTFVDPDTGVSLGLTTVAVSPSGTLNPNSGTLGVNAVGGGDTAGAFDNGESWTFRWDTGTEWEGVDFGSFSSGAEEFRVSSPAFVGLSGIVPGDGNIVYQSSQGSFVFANADASDNFTLSDLSGGVSLAIPAGTDITIAFSDSGGGSATIESLTFAAPVPEPSTTGILALLLGHCVMRRGKRRIRPIQAGIRVP